ncbi:uncharacterized protein LOC121426606 [Lytechinus variegatus]|uniref:uncharacterized protein LOC121426606 n=1 Tax=Lytechinus variegatus TaxID=7654 RepID=UPI001BB17EF5|nr:uncharacterized protein LOC121426606 [Lytechinus variegatus]
MKLMLLIVLSVLGSVVIAKSTIGFELPEEFHEDETDLKEDDYRLLIDNDPDGEDDFLSEEDIDILLTSWFTKAGNSLHNWGQKAKKWTHKAVHDSKHWTKTAVHDTKHWTQNAEHDTKHWTNKAVHDTKKWTKKAAHDVGGAIKKGCKVVNKIPFKGLVLQLKESLKDRGISEEEVSEDQVAAVASGIYKGIKFACHAIDH